MLPVFGKIEETLKKINETHDADALVPAVLDLVLSGIDAMKDGKISFFEAFRLGGKLLSLIKFAKRSA